MKTSAWRRSSSAIIGGWVAIVETTPGRHDAAPPEGFVVDTKSEHWD